jgi:hypothetical protein
MTESHPDPITEGLSHTGQRIVQLFAAGAAAHEVRGQLQQWRSAAHDARQMQQARDAQALRDAEFNTARAVWAPAHDAEWLANADLYSTARAMSAGLAYADDHQPASAAVRKCEARLRELHPHAMGFYDRFREEGLSHREAIAKAAPYFDLDPRSRTADPPTTRPGLPVGSGVEWAESPYGPERGEWQEHRLSERARRVATAVQGRLSEGGRQPLSPEDLRTVLTATTNLPEHVIADAVPVPAPTGARQPADVAADDHPIGVSEAMAMTDAAGPVRAASGKPRSPYIDRERHLGR